MTSSLNICTLALLLLILNVANSIPHRRNNIRDENDEAMHPRFKSSRLQKNMAIPDHELTSNFWLAASKDAILKKRIEKVNMRMAKNVILFLGDGMGLATLAAARNYIGGESRKLSFENFPYTGLSRTYAVDKMVPDSACTSTAYLCGVKANYGTIGVSAAVERDDCEGMRDERNQVDSIAKWAMNAGKAAGLVTTARVTHASPAGVYAHTADREWEYNTLLEETCGVDSGLDDIAVQLVHGKVGSKLKVMLGGGRKMMYDAVHHKKGLRTDGRNLVNEFLQQSTENVFVETQKELNKVKLSKNGRLLGLFSNGHMDYHLEALEDKKNKQPTLAEMTQKAIEVLQNENNGYFLFVEGGKIDMGHHYTWARHALEETSEFSKAIELAKNITNDDETLIIVTSDHSHTFSMAGYSTRGEDIFEVASKKANDDLPYLPLSYANGPSFEAHYDVQHKKRRDPHKVIEGKMDDVFPATVPLTKETHGGEDVAVFATGPWSELFTGVYDQHVLPHMMAYAGCFGNGLKACQYA